MKIVIVLMEIFILYFLVQYVSKLKNNYKYYIRLLLNSRNRIRTKINELKYIKIITFLLNESNLSLKFKGINIISTLSIIVLSILFSSLTFIFTFTYLHVFLSSIILSSFTFFIPYYVIKYISYRKKINILNIFPNYVINLKNYTDVNNDIIDAFRRANVEEPLNSYIHKFNISIQKGVKIYDAFETLKNSINIERINQFITLLQFCYIYGGNFSVLLDKFSKIQMKANIQREEEKQKIFSAKLVLIVLIALNIYILYGFILSNNQYYNIMVNTFVGNMILNINILSYIFIFYMYIKLNKMEE